MKLKQYITLVILCISGYTFIGCSDDLNMVGAGIQPESDFITIYTDTFQITASTVKKDSLYAKTIEGLLGEFYDPLYGHLKSDFLCQFYCQDGYTFRETPYGGKIDSMSLFIHYTYIGNPQASMQIQAYPVTEPLNKIYYTHIDPEMYCDMQSPLGKTVFTPTSGIVSDSTVQEYLVEVRLPVELGQKFYDETINNPSSFANQTAFNQFFPGIYVTTDYGSGSMLKVVQTSLSISYNYALKDVAGNDSLIVGYEHFTTTKEVIQLNRIESQHEEQLLVNNDDYTFLKTPSGIFTRLVFPAKEIASVVEERMLNNLAFNLKYMPQEEWIYSLAPPPQLLLIPEDSLSSYFSENNTENGITTFLSYPGGSSPTVTLSGYDAATRTYTFGNIVNLMSYHIQQNPDEDLRVLVVPVHREIYRYSSGSVWNYATTSINHYFAPAGVKLRKDTESMKMVLISSQYAKKR